MKLKCAECGETLKRGKGIALTTASLAIHHEKVVCTHKCFSDFHTKKNISISLGVPFYYKISMEVKEM